jgi:RsiW-degrading membrane proteinase PrsW (M82 family)
MGQPSKWFWPLRYAMLGLPLIPLLVLERSVGGPVHASAGSSAQWWYSGLAVCGFLLLFRAAVGKSASLWDQVKFVTLGGTVGVVLVFGVDWLAEQANAPGGWADRCPVAIRSVLQLIGASRDLFHQPGTAPWILFVAFTFGVGVTEEACKALPFARLGRWDLCGRREEACSMGFASGLGFGVSEGIIYSIRNYNGQEGWELYAIRFVSLAAVWTAMVALLIHRGRVIIEFGTVGLSNAVGVLWPAVLLHGAYDAFLGTQHLAAARGVAVLGFGVFWVLMVLNRREAEGVEATGEFGLGRRTFGLVVEFGKLAVPLALTASAIPVVAVVVLLGLGWTGPDNESWYRVAAALHDNQTLAATVGGCVGAGLLLSAWAIFKSIRFPEVGGPMARAGQVRTGGGRSWKKPWGLVLGGSAIGTAVLGTWSAVNKGNALVVLILAGVVSSVLGFSAWRTLRSAGPEGRKGERRRNDTPEFGQLVLLCCANRDQAEKLVQQAIDDGANSRQEAVRRAIAYVERKIGG